jgi:hypothetical protein
MYCRGTTPPVMRSTKRIPSPARQRRDLQHDIAILAMPAALLAVPAARCAGLADRLAIAICGGRLSTATP